MDISNQVNKLEKNLKITSLKNQNIKLGDSNITKQ